MNENFWFWLIEKSKIIGVNICADKEERAGPRKGMAWQFHPTPSRLDCSSARVERGLISRTQVSCFNELFYETLLFPGSANKTEIKVEESLTFDVRCTCAMVGGRITLVN